MSWIEVTILVDKAKLGDRQAYGELVERFQQAVYARALVLVHDPLEAQELTQEVFVHGMKKLDQLRDPRCFGGWLRRITDRMASNRRSRRGKLFGAETEVLEALHDDRTAEPSAELERAEATAELREGLKRLKPLDRQTLEAFYLRGQSLQEMARDFDTPVGTIKRRLHVARQRLKDVLEAPGQAQAITASSEPGTPRSRKPRRRRELAGV